MSLQFPMPTIQIISGTSSNNYQPLLQHSTHLSARYKYCWKAVETLGKLHLVVKTRGTLDLGVKTLGTLDLVVKTLGTLDLVVKTLETLDFVCQDTRNTGFGCQDTRNTGFGCQDTRNTGFRCDTVSLVYHTGSTNPAVEQTNKSQYLKFLFW